MCHILATGIMLIACRHQLEPSSVVKHGKLGKLPVVNRVPDSKDPVKEENVKNVRI